MFLSLCCLRFLLFTVLKGRECQACSAVTNFCYRWHQGIGAGTGPACLSDCLPAFLTACLPACLLACLSVCLSVCMSVCLSVCLSVRVLVCLPACLSLSLSLWGLSVCLALSSCLSLRWGSGMGEGGGVVLGAPGHPKPGV